MTVTEPERTNLEEFNDPPNYDIEEASSTLARLPYCTKLVRDHGGPLLDLCCGSGLITLPMVAHCSDVTGVDLSSPMLAHARAKAAQLGRTVHWHEADARNCRLGRQFNVILLTGNAFQAFLRDEDQRLLLQTVKVHLRPAGIFLFDTRNPTAHDLSDKPQEEFWFDYCSAEGSMVRVSGTQAFDSARHIMLWTTYRRSEAGAQSRSRVSQIACRFTSNASLRRLLADHGFVINWQHGDWSGGPLADTSEQIITGCQLA